MTVDVQTTGAAPERTSSSHDVALSRKVRRVLARATSVSSSNLECWQHVSILAFGNSQYVSAELYYRGDNRGMLRARSDNPFGDWEQFTVCRDPSTGATLMASEANRQLVSAELGCGDDAYGMLRARAVTAGPWEWFYTNNPPNSGQPHAAPVGRNWTAIKSAANGLFVSAELGYGRDRYGMLRARANAPDTWEWFFW
jgi:hypothetical protein